VCLGEIHFYVFKKRVIDATKNVRKKSGKSNQKKLNYRGNQAQNKPQLII
jgi:hypothetical protein